MATPPALLATYRTLHLPAKKGLHLLLVAFSQDFDSYKDAEKCRSQHGSTEAQMLLRQPDYATLSLRIDPATVSIEQRDDSTWLTIDSANFPGTTRCPEQLWPKT